MHPTLAAPAHITTVVDRAVIARLQRCRAYPSVSVLLTTTPGPLLSSHDIGRLDRLLLDAARRLADEPGDHRADADAALARLRKLAVTVRRVPAGRGLALFAHHGHAEAVQLAVEVDERVVVDPTFATRDLVRSWRVDPRYRVLVLAEQGCRLYEGRSANLREVTGGGFPVLPAGSGDRQDRSRRFGRERSNWRNAGRYAQMRAIDAALAGRRARDPLPLVVAGVPRQIATFRDRCAEAGSMVGEITGSHGRTAPSRLAQLARPVLERHRGERSLDALTQLDAGLDRGRLVAGIDEVWTAAAERRVGLLCVEETFFLPARLTRGGRGLHPATDVEHPDVLDDAVDELIELVSLAGGTVALVDDGALAAHGRVAALTCE